MRPNAACTCSASAQNKCSQLVSRTCGDARFGCQASEPDAEHGGSGERADRRPLRRLLLPGEMKPCRRGQQATRSRRERFRRTEERGRRSGQLRTSSCLMCRSATQNLPRSITSSFRFYFFFFLTIIFLHFAPKSWKLNWQSNKQKYIQILHMFFDFTKLNIIKK